MLPRRRTICRNSKPRCAQRPALIIDGLFGIGLNRPLDDGWKKFITAVNASKIPVLAVDVPSGLNADSGATPGAAIEAAVTLTVGAPKIGMLAPDAWPFVGRLEVADDVGLIPCPHRGELNWTLPEDFAGFPPRRACRRSQRVVRTFGDHRGQFRFSRRSGFGRARRPTRAARTHHDYITQETIYHAVASQLQAVMVNVWKPETENAGIGQRHVDWPGPGGCGICRRTEDADAAIVAAAGAQLAFADDCGRQRAGLAACRQPWRTRRFASSRRIPAKRRGCWARPCPQVQANRLHAVREISQRYGDCWVVLKGHQTLVGRSTGEIFVNPSGNPHLAQGGSGDVLAGFIAGLLAQPALQADAGKAIRYAVWLHGATADALQAARTNWVIEDLAAELGQERR